MRSELDPIRTGRLSLLGAHKLTLCGIRWVGEPTDEEFDAARALDGVIKRVEAWVEGDLIVEFVRREKDKRPAMSVRSLVGEYATRAGLQYDQCYERYHVAQAFTIQERATKLTWSHHRVIWAHGGQNKRDQLKWLHLAEDKGWDVRALSAAIMAKRITPGSTPAPIASLFPPELQGAVDWASSRLDEVNSLTPDQAAARAQELDPLVEYHSRCTARAKEKQNAPTATGKPEDMNVGAGC